jgi:putative membrane protein
MWGDGHGWGMMGDGWGMMGGWGGGAFSMIFWALVLVALVAGVIWFVRSSSSAGAGRSQLPRRSSGLDILEERYARGEINRDEYLQKKQEISG